ncbi:MAG: response regulator [Candidatus Thermoplasmatota archaeon]
MKKIMMVDDEKDQIFSIKTALETKYGGEYKIIPAESGEKCLEKLQKDEKPDLILLDIMMPEMDGWEVMDKIKANSSWKNIPIIFLTARSKNTSEKSGEDLGEDYIEKPIYIQDLKEKIDKILKN